MPVEEEENTKPLCIYLHRDQCVRGQYDGRPTEDNCAECTKYVGRPRGLGDRVANVLKAVGVDAAVEGIAKQVGMNDCGCGKRRKYLNEKFPNQDGKP